MGVSTTLTHAILTIAAVIMASLFVIGIIGQLNTVMNTINIAIKTRSDTYRTSISIIYAYYDDTNNKIYIYIKNTGEIPYSGLNKSIDIFIVDANNVVDYYNLHSELLVGNATLTEYDAQDNILKPRETAEIILSAKKIYAKPLEIKLTFSNGYTASYVTG
jgi:flagellar protein FlaG